jgi:hypothetical protein
MTASTDLGQATIREIVDRIFMTRQITRSDQARFMAIVLGEAPLTAEDRTHVDRVFDGLQRGLQRGLLRVVD